MESLALHSTVYTLKGTLLVFGPQLGSAVVDDARVQQGHHADPRKSCIFTEAILYGAPSIIRHHVFKQMRYGFRPKTAQHHGASFF